jgi:polar amino acid transport system substrate-binding protein
MDLDIDAALAAELAPHGRLRVALNLSNFLLVQPDGAGGGYRGVAPDLGRDIAARLGVPAAMVAYSHAGKVADAAAGDEWDIGFIGAEPQREDVIAFTPAYVEIEATYLVRGDSPIRAIADVDRPGVRIVTADRSAYDLYLARTIRNAELVRAPGIPASFERFVAEGCEVLAGLKPRLLQDQARLPGSRILDGRFTAIQQAIGTPRPRVRAAQWLARYVAHVKASGAVAAAISRHGVEGLSVAAA